MVLSSFVVDTLRPAMIKSSRWGREGIKVRMGNSDDEIAEWAARGDSRTNEGFS